MENNISQLSSCYGCGVCVKACPVKIISLQENEKGFYSPQITDKDKCINCGLCLKICAYNHNEVCQEKNVPISSYAGWSNNTNVRQWCSSGGIGFEIGKHLIENGYEAIGVRYNPTKNRSEHYIASTVKEFMPSVGSKYIPSYPADALLAIDKNKKYLVTGTPCQIDSIRRLVKQMRIEDNFVLLDFFCHGVPSLLVWDKYIEEVKSKIGEISFASWRNKSTGWHDSWAINADAATDGETVDWHDSYNLLIKEKKHFYSSRMSQGDLFYSFFLGNYCLNRCCYQSCKYKMMNSAADIRIGDLWGNKYKDNTQGVSAILCFTDKGQSILNEIANGSTLKMESPAVVTEGQMRKCARMPGIYEEVINELQTSKTLAQIKNGLIRRYNRKFLPIRIVNRLLSIMHFPKIKY